MTTIALSQLDTCRLPPADERGLMARVAAGDARAVDELYCTYAAALYGYARYLMGERCAAEDVLQEAFVAAWRGAARWRGDCALKTWLLRITHHMAVSHWRATHPTQALADYEWLADERAASIEPRPDLRAALAGLSANHRLVIYLTFVEDRSQADIAAIMGCSVGTIKSRMHYALRALRAKLEPHE